MSGDLGFEGSNSRIARVPVSESAPPVLRIHRIPGCNCSPNHWMQDFHSHTLRSCSSIEIETIIMIVIVIVIVMIIISNENDSDDNHNDNSNENDGNDCNNNKNNNNNIQQVCENNQRCPRKDTHDMFVILFVPRFQIKPCNIATKEEAL